MQPNGKRTTKQYINNVTKGSAKKMSEKYIYPYDNLLYAILLQAAKDSRKPCHEKECKRFFETTGKSIYNYLSKRPVHRQGYCFEDNGYLLEVQKSYRLNKARKIKSKKGTVIK